MQDHQHVGSTLSSSNRPDHIIPHQHTSNQREQRSRTTRLIPSHPSSTIQTETTLHYSLQTLPRRSLALNPQQSSHTHPTKPPPLPNPPNHSPQHQQTRKTKRLPNRRLRIIQHHHLPLRPLRNLPPNPPQKPRLPILLPKNLLPPR